METPCVEVKHQEMVPTPVPTSTPTPAKPTDYTKNSVEPDRRMAWVVTVKELVPIPNALNVELAKLVENEWQCIVKKADFKVGDLGIYFTVDSVLDPENKNSAFLKGAKLKTKKILNTLSQGLLAPLAWVVDYGTDPSSLKVDDDVTKLLRVRKFVHSAELHEYSGEGKGRLPWPVFLKKTDEERVQNCPTVLAELVGEEVVITQKRDGTSTTFAWLLKGAYDAGTHAGIDAVSHVGADVGTDAGTDAGKGTHHPQCCCDDKQGKARCRCRHIPRYGTFLVCGRNHILVPDHEDAKKGNVHYFAMATRYNLHVAMQKLGSNLGIQGETVGPKINGNRMMLTELDFEVFNIWDVDSQSYLPWSRVVDLTTKLKLKTVPVVWQGVFTKEMASFEFLQKLASEQEYAPGVPAEGIVVKSAGGNEKPRHSFKVISNVYLLKHSL